MYEKQECEDEMSNYKQNEIYADMAKNPSRKALEELRRKPYQAAGQPAHINKDLKTLKEMEENGNE